MRSHLVFIVSLAGTLNLFAASASAAPATNENVLIFSAPPRETAEQGAATYKPLTDYLSKVTGKTVKYSWPRTWGVYRTQMINGQYDIVFDGPHFVGWRIQKLKHHAVVKLPSQFDFAVFVRKDTKVSSVSELGGLTVCAQSPPNLGALVILSQFEKSATQPILVPSKGLEPVYKGVVSGKCTGGVLPAAAVNKRDTDGKIKTLYVTEQMPDQAISVSSRVSQELRAKIAAALLSPEGAAATEKLRTKFGGGDNFVATKNAEYVGYADLLKDQWGFNDEVVAAAKP